MKELILELKTATSLLNKRSEIIEFRIIIIKKELELGHALESNGRKYYLGEKLDEEHLKGRKYELKCLEEEMDRLYPKAF